MTRDPLPPPKEAGSAIRAAFRKRVVSAEISYVPTFVTVDQLGTISKAAQQSHIAQPASSRQITELEREATRDRPKVGLSNRKTEPTAS